VFQIEDPPLVDPDQVPDAQAVRALRAELGLTEAPIALYSGNLKAYQGVEMLVDAAGLAPEVQLLLMGGEPVEIDRLLTRSRNSGAESRCYFVGKRPPSQLPLFLALADVVVSPRSRGENTPFKIYTYLAAGRPLVATRIPTHTQLLDDSLAFLVEATPEGLAQGIRSVLRQPEEAGARARRGRELIEREYSATRYKEKVAAAYGEIVRSVERSA
jgi:glycosyltransferase involved in cell wall biosynthesis